MKDNEGYVHGDDGEIHPGEVVKKRFLYRSALAFGYLLSAKTR